jgi:hypothetical protein
MDDAETLAYLRSNVASELDIPERMSHRIAGSTLQELREDGRRLAAEIGIAPADNRVAGRFTGKSARGATFNDLVRKAAGRTS